MKQSQLPFGKDDLLTTEDLREKMPAACESRQVVIE